MKVQESLLLIVEPCPMLVTTAAGAQSLNGDRVYTGDQTSNTVSVIDPATTKIVGGVIRLGDPVPGALSPLYKGALLVHGLGFSPDHRKPWLSSPLARIR